VGDVGGQRVLDLADAAIVDSRVAPGVVGEVRIDRHADHFHVAGLEVRDAVIESDQLGRADEGEVQRVEEHQGVLALGGGAEAVVLDDGTIGEDGGNGEIRGGLANENGHGALLFAFSDG